MIQPRINVVSTSRDFRASAVTCWRALLFYEELEQAPPFFLRRLLPIPLGTAGVKSTIGSRVKCLYATGYLVKQITAVDTLQRIAFDVIEQQLSLHRVRLLGGEYDLVPIGPALTRVTLSTRYASPHQPARIFTPAEALVCHCFHRHLLKAMQRKLARELAPAVAT